MRRLALSTIDWYWLRTALEIAAAEKRRNAETCRQYQDRAIGENAEAAARIAQSLDREEAQYNHLLELLEAAEIVPDYRPGALV